MTADSARRFRLRVSDVPPPTADLVVVGAGIVGCATAFRATRAGLRTVVLDARPRPATLTTPAATGAYRLQFDNAEEIALVREGLELYQDFANQAGLPGFDIGLRAQGYLFCAREEPTIERQRALVERQHAFGLTDVELLDGDEVRHRFPFIAETVRGARYRAADGFIDQVRLAWGYAFAASATILYAGMAVLEYRHVIRHVPVPGLFPPAAYRNTSYVVVVVVAFLLAIGLTAILSLMVSGRLREQEMVGSVERESE